MRDKFFGITIAALGILLLSLTACGVFSNGPTVTGKQQVCQVKDAQTAKLVQVPAADCTPTSNAYDQHAAWYFYLIMSDHTRQPVGLKQYRTAARGDSFDEGSHTVTHGDTTVDEGGHVSVHVDPPVEVHPVIVDK